MATSARNLSALGAPPARRRKAGLKGVAERGFKPASQVITASRVLTSAGDEYSPAQRRIIDARLTKARTGPYHGPFETAEETISFIRKEIRKRKATKSK